MNRRTKKQLKEFEKNLGYEFKDHSLLEQSLTHKSYVNEMNDERLKDNERLEFLGDAVLSLLVTCMLMEYFPDLSEGILSKKRSGLVNEKVLAKLARKITLGDFLSLGKGEEMTEGRDKDSILANAFEAIIGSLFMDGGLEASKSFISKYFKSLIRYSAKPGSYKDYKTLCQETAQRLFKKTPEYRLVGVKGPEHKKLFESEIFVGEESFGKGKGRSKKDSEQKCARTALKKMEKLS